MDEVWVPSPNYHDGRSSYRLLVFHTTQSDWTWKQACDYFAQASSKVSAHHTADPFTLGTFGACVDERYCAWTQGNANGECISIELCGYAEWDRATWLGEKYILVRNAAEWGRTLAARYDIPLRWLSPSQSQDHHTTGLTQHDFLDEWGGNHFDCGSGFPDDVVMQLMQSGDTGTGTREGERMIAGCYWQNSAWTFKIGEDGAIWFFGPDVEAWTKIQGSHAKGSLSAGSSDAGALTVWYENDDGHVCNYHRKPGGGVFDWNDQGPR